MWYNPGANHAPHHAPQEYIAKYKGKFDDGYDAYRTWVLARMIEKGVLPKDTKLTPINPLPESQANPADHVRPWNTLNADEKRLFSRMAEVFAALDCEDFAILQNRSRWQGLGAFQQRHAQCL